MLPLFCQTIKCYHYVCCFTANSTVNNIIHFCLRTFVTVRYTQKFRCTFRVRNMNFLKYLCLKYFSYTSCACLSYNTTKKYAGMLNELRNTNVAEHVRNVASFHFHVPRISLLFTSEQQCGNHGDTVRN